MEPVRAKVDLVRDGPVPKTAYDVRQFLGLASYYQRFVKGFASIAAPLHDLLKESDEVQRKKKFRSVEWPPKCDQALVRL